MIDPALNQLVAQNESHKLPTQLNFSSNLVSQVAFRALESRLDEGDAKHFNQKILDCVYESNSEALRRLLLENKIIGRTEFYSNVKKRAFSSSDSKLKGVTKVFLNCISSYKPIDDEILIQAISICITKNDMESLKVLLNKRSIPQTILIKAIQDTASQGKFIFFEFLLSKVTQFNQGDFDQIFINAANNNYFDIIKSLLLEKRVTDPKTLKEGCKSAAWRGHLELFKFLLPQVGQFNQREFNEIFINSSRNSYVSIIRLFLSEKTIIDHEIIKEAFRVASFEGSLAVIEFLLLEGHVTDRITISDAFKNAAKRTHFEVVKFLLPKVNQDQDTLSCAIIAASRNGQLDIVEFLLGMINDREILFKAFVCALQNNQSNIIVFLSNVIFSANLCALIDEVIKYKNPDLRDFLISSFSKFDLERFEKVFSGETSWGVSHKFTQAQIDHIRLLILAVESLGIDSAMKESMIAALKKNYKAFKDWRKQQTLLQLMGLINSYAFHPNRYYQKIISVLQNKTTFLGAIQFCKVIIQIDSQIFFNLKESDLNIENLSRVCLKLIEQFCPSENERERCLDAIMDLRDPGGVFVYISNFFNVEKRDMKLAIQKLFKGILDPKQFIIDRNNKSPHLNEVSLDVKKNWTTPLAPVEDVTIEDSKVKIDIRAFLIEKLITDRHANGNFKNLIEMIQTEKEPSEPMTDLENQIHQLIDIKEDQLVTELASILEKMKTENLTRIEFYHDIQGLIQQLNSKLSSIEKFILVDSDDIQDLLYCGTEVDGSCLRLDGLPDMSCCLMGYVLDGKIRLLAIKNKDGRIVSRVIIKLLFNDKNEPVIFFERVYGRLEFSEKLLEYAHEKAKQLNVPLYKAWGVTKLASIGNAAPYEYEDGAVGVSNGVYIIEGQLA